MPCQRVGTVKYLCILVFLVLCVPVLANQTSANQSAGNQTATNQVPASQTAAVDVPVVDGGIGPCKADFTVKDGNGKPLYDAKVSVTLRYGFWSKRKTDLQVGTNSDGKARITGLPDAPKKPLEFTIKSGTVSKTVTDDPSSNCTATFDVTMTVH